MTNRTLNKLSILAVSMLSFGLMPANAQDRTFLHGSVNVNEQHGSPAKSMPSLERGKNTADPFVPAAELFDAPEAMFDNQSMNIPAPPRSFQLNAGESGEIFQGMPGVPMEAPRAPMQPNMAYPNMLQPPGLPVEPDNSEHMKLQWDLWHKRVAEAIYVRFDVCATRAFANSKPLACLASYTVTRDRRIVNVKLDRKSDSLTYNMMLLTVLNSMSGNPLLEFPPGTNRQCVFKSGTFSRNCGTNGYKHTINDNETIRSSQPHMRMNPSS